MSEQHEEPRATVTMLPARREPHVSYEALESMRDVIRNVLAPKATDDELTFFFKVAEAVQLDPWKKQLYLIPRWDKRANGGKGGEVHQPQAAIDGFRAIAHRTGEYEGQLGPFWCARERDDAGQPIWVDVWLSRENTPAAAKVGVLRKGFTQPLWAVAIFEEYVQTKTYDNPDGQRTVRLGMWEKMPANQLAKCAEALALRRAFPEETAGLVTVDEVASEYDDGQELQADLPQAVQLDAAAALASDVDVGAEREDVVREDGAAAPGDGAAAAPPPGVEVEPTTGMQPPWPTYDTENVRLIHSKLEELTDREAILCVGVYEEATKKRSGVLSKVEYRLAELPDEELVVLPAARDDDEGTATSAGGDASSPAAAPPAPFQVVTTPETQESQPLSPAERLERACELTFARWPEELFGWEPEKVLAQAASLFERPIQAFTDLTADEIDSIWSAIPDEIRNEVLGNGAA